MMKKLLPLLVIVATCVSIQFSGCKKEHEDSLPAATQVGANTFGCKINGKVYVPKGSSGTGAPNPKIQYDIGLNAIPYFNIDARKYENASSVGDLFIAFGNVNREGLYSYPTDFNLLFGWEKFENCGITVFDSTINKTGSGTITRLDISNRIVSGTFNFKYKTSQCDTIYITDGRFDMKF